MDRKCFRVKHCELQYVYINVLFLLISISGNLYISQWTETEVLGQALRYKAFFFSYAYCRIGLKDTWVR